MNYELTTSKTVPGKNKANSLIQYKWRKVNSSQQTEASQQDGNSLMVELANIAPASSVSGCTFCQPEVLKLHGIFRHHAITSRLCWTLRADALRATQLRRYVQNRKMHREKLCQ
jgi:hypothetical protein